MRPNVSRGLRTDLQRCSLPSVSDARATYVSFQDMFAVARESPPIRAIEAKWATAAAVAMAAAARALGRLDHQLVDAVVVTAIASGHRLDLDTAGQSPGSAVAASPRPAHAPPAPRASAAA